MASYTELDGLEGLSRHDLQQMAKALGIKANQKSTDLIIAIREMAKQVAQHDTDDAGADYAGGEPMEPKHHAVTPKTPAMSQGRRTFDDDDEVEGEYDDDLVEEKDEQELLDDAPAPFLANAKFANSNSDNVTKVSSSAFPRATLGVKGKIRSPTNLSTTTPSKWRTLASTTSMPSAPQNRDTAANVRLLARVNGRLSPPKDSQSGTVTINFSSSAPTTIERRLIHPRTIPKNPEALSGVRRASINLQQRSPQPMNMTVKTPARGNENVKAVNTGVPASGPAKELNARTPATTAQDAAKTPGTALKEAMRMERERRRASRALLAVDQNWECVESKSKPGQFYYWNSVTQQACWELPSRARLSNPLLGM